MNPSFLPFQKVFSFNELTQTPLQSTNALCWERYLHGNFEEIVQILNDGSAIVEVDLYELSRINLSTEGKIAREVLKNDFKLLEKLGAQPALNIVNRYPKDTDAEFISTDVYSFHVDRSPVLIDTYLCTYHGTSSDILPTAFAKKCVEVEEIRAELRKLFEGDEKDFELFLTENFFDLHYIPLPEAPIYSLGLHNLWRLAVDHPDQKVPACIHRAPLENDIPRLMMIC